MSATPRQRRAGFGAYRTALARGLIAVSALLGTACTSPVAPPGRPVVRVPPEDVRVEHVADLLTSVRLRWVVLARPAELMPLPWLRPHLARIFRDERLDELERTTGIDLRDTPELALAAYGLGEDEAVAYLVRHKAADPLSIERKFRQRLTGGEEKLIEGHQLSAMWGTIGVRTRGFASIGRDVVGFQFGGERQRGPLRIALLYAQGKLTSVPTALTDPGLAPLSERLGGAAVKACLAGPFEGDLARGARGLLAGATGVCAGLTPTEQQTFELRVMLGGDFGDEGATYLASVWSDLAASDLGHLLGLSSPRTPPSVTAEPEALVLTAELEAAALLDGLAAATVDDVREMMD